MSWSQRGTAGPSPGGQGLSPALGHPSPISSLWTELPGSAAFCLDERGADTQGPQAVATPQGDSLALITV